VQLVLFRKIMAYNIDFEKKGDILLHIRKFLLYPRHWEDCSKQIPTNLKWKKIKFNSANKSKIPNNIGLYCFVVKPLYKNFIDMSYLFYIGQTQNSLRIRYSNYLAEQAGKGKPRTKVFEMLNLYSKYIYFYYTLLANKDLINDYEKKLINTFVPQINTSIPEAKINHELKYIYEH